MRGRFFDIKRDERKMNITFEELAQQWCEKKQPIVKESSMCAYRLILCSHLLPRFGQMRAITEAEAQAFLLEKIKGGLSKKTVRDVIAVLRSVVRYGARQKRFEAVEWELSYPTGEKVRKLPVLSLRHQRKLTAYLTENIDPRTIGVLMALCTGMRIGEVCALRWEDVDLPHRTIRVCQTSGCIYDSDMKQTRCVISTPKTKNSYREIPISRTLFDALCFLKKQKTAPYIVGAREAPTSPRTYREYFTRLLGRLGIPRIVFHGLRHTFATRCVESGCDYKTISAILGHANVAITLNLYVHPNIDQKKRCIDKMSKFIG